MKIETALPIPGYPIPRYLLGTQYPGIMHGYPGIRKNPCFGGFGDDFGGKNEKIFSLVKHFFGFGH